MLRAYSARDTRQQDADRLVTTEDELRNVITDGVANGSMATIRLAADIMLSAPVTLPSNAGVGVVIDGGNKWGIYAQSASVPCIFRTDGNNSNPVLLRSLTLGAKANATFDVPAVFGFTGTFFVVQKLTLRDVKLQDCTALWQAGSNPNINTCQFVGVDPESRTSTPIVITCQPSFCLFESIPGVGATWTLTNAFSNTFIECSGIETQVDSLAAQNFGVPGDRNHVFSSSNGRSLLSGSTLFAGSISTQAKAVTLSGAGPTLTPGDASYVRVTMAASSGNITIATGFDGQLLTIEFLNAAGTAKLTSGAGNVTLQGTVTPAANVVVDLIFDASTNAWVERNRSVPFDDSRLWVGAEGGYGQNFLRSSLPASVNAFTMVTGDAMFVYLGLTKTARTINSVKFFVSTIGAGAQTAEVGLFSTPLAPNGLNQSLTKIVATGTVDALTATGIKGNTNPFAQVVPANTHLWAGLRTAMVTTQPVIGGIGLDYAQGHILKCAASGVLTGAGPFAGTVLAAAASAAQAPGLMGYL